MAGRPTQRTPANAKKIMDAIRMGATYELACGYAGISKDTFDRWRAADEAFAAQVKEAEGAAAVGWLAKIEKAANDGAWQAAAWKLERRYPESYGRQVLDTRNEHSGPNGGPIPVAIDRRTALAAIAPRSMGDSDAPGAGEGDHDGA